MILKILPRHSAGAIQSLLRYIQNHAKSQDGQTHLILQNVRSKDVGEQTTEFLKNEAYRKVFRKDAVFVRHEILSFSPKNSDSITLDILQNIGREYIRLRGEKALIVGAIHNEGKDHFHIHFAVSGLEVVTGRSTHVPRPKLNEIKLKLQSYYLVKYPELTESAVRHGLGREYNSQKEYQMSLRTKRNSKREEIIRTVRTCLDESKTQNEFLERLRDAGLPHYERKGVPQGIISQSLKFRFSRLSISLKNLQIDFTQEEKTLDEIQRLRNQTHQRNRDTELSR